MCKGGWLRSRLGDCYLNSEFIFSVGDGFPVPFLFFLQFEIQNGSYNRQSIRHGFAASPPFHKGGFFREKNIDIQINILKTLVNTAFSGGGGLENLA